MMDHHSDPGENTLFTGHDLVDREGHKIGTVSDVVYDQSEADATHPRWLVVDLGVLGGSHYAPARAARFTGDGELVATFGKQQVKSAPKAKGAHVVTADLERQIELHYAATV